MRLPLICTEYLEASRGEEMPLLNVDFQQEPDHLVFMVRGSYDLTEAVERFPMVIAACRQIGLARALVDYRDLGGEIGAAQEIIYAQAAVDFYKQHLSTGGRPLRIAFIGREPKPWKDGEEIAKDYGLDVLVTTDYDEALDWLFSEAPGDEI